jgi:tetratricopeptide (TPR) repeat protein
VSQSDFVNRGQALVASGQYQEAVKVCRLGLLGRPTTVEGRVVLGQALLALKRFDEVLAEMRIALELDHSSIPSLVLKGEALLRKGDSRAAFETLTKARDAAPDDRAIRALVNEAEQAMLSPRKNPTMSHPSVGFVAQSTDDDDVETALPPPGGRYKRATEAGTPARRRASAPTAPPPVAGNRSETGSLELDPDADVLDDDIGALAPPPGMRKSKAVDKPRGPAPKSGMPRRDSGMELGDDDLLDVDEETPPPVNAGPARAARGPAQYQVAASSPTASLASAIAGTPHVMQVTPVAAQPQVPATSARAATMVPQALVSQQMPAPQPMQPMYAPMPAAYDPPPPVQQPAPQSYAAAAMPTMAIQPPPALSTQHGHAPWAQATVAAGMPTPGGGLDPALAALAASVDANQSGSSLAGATPVPAERGSMKTGMRRTRSPARVILWVVLGAAVIGGGVFAGFQIRAMRLGNQIESARVRVTALAKEDNWAGWAAARDGLAGIVQASNTLDNRAALARARATIAFEFGDGLAEAKQAVDALKGEGGLDGQLAAAYLALAQDDPKAAKTASDAALAAAPNDASALYVAGRAQLAAGDASGSVAHLKAAAEKDPRALYALGLAQAYGEANDWDDAIAATEQAVAASADNPAALIERADLDARMGRIQPGNSLGMEVRSQLDKIVAEAARPMAEQTRGVSAEQVALADVALARVQLAGGDAGKALASVKAALALQLDDQRVVEAIIGVLYRLDDFQRARTAADESLAHWPTSRRARIVLAEALTGLGKPDEALAAIAKSGEVTTLPLGLVARADAKVASGDQDGARADYEAALKREPKLEAAMIGLVAVDLATGKPDDARKLVEPRFSGKDATASLAMTTAFAAALRATGDAAMRDRARLLLEKPAGTAAGAPDVVRAKVELARIYRDAGSLREARDAYGEAAAAGSIDARLESGVMQTDDRDPKSGYDTLAALVKSLPSPSANVLIETARAAMLVGDHAAASAYLDQAEKARGLVRWQLDRERGRLAFRRGDMKGAADALGRALEACGPDTETFLLVADVVFADLSAMDDKTPAHYPDLAAKLTGQLGRISGRPEADVVAGILALANNKLDDAAKFYEKATTELGAEKAISRRSARAAYGMGILAYLAKNIPDAKNKLDLAIEEDPSSYSAYLYRADMESDGKDAKGALDFARKAVAYNPELVDGWYLVGKYAHDTADKKSVEQAIAMITAIAPDSPRIKELQQLK